MCVCECARSVVTLINKKYINSNKNSANKASTGITEFQQRLLWPLSGVTMFSTTVLLLLLLHIHLSN